MPLTYAHQLFEDIGTTNDISGMELHFTLSLIVLVLVTSRQRGTFAAESVSNENKQVGVYTFTKEPYVFPEIHDGNALQPTLDLLLSQQRYHAEMDRIYQNMVKNNPNAHHLESLRAMLQNTRLMMSVDVESIQEYLTTGAPDDEIKRQPWCGASSYSVLNSWRKMKEWSEKMRDQRIDAEIDAMAKVVDSAVAELEVYEKYADIFYEQMKTTTEAESESLFNED